MALFDLFGSKKPPVKKTVTVKAVPKKKTYAETAGVINTGVDAYSCGCSVEDYFAQVLERNFAGYEIRRNVDFGELYNVSSSAAVPVPAAGTWKCSCGHTCKGAFCPECGNKKPEPKPVPAGPWTCACGSVNKGNFCPECGAKRPVSNDWTCSVCGNKNKSKFCPVCGKAKPAAAAPAPAPVRADEGPAVTLSFATMFQKSVQSEAAKGKYPQLNFVIYKNGKPDVAILLTPKADYDNMDKWNTVNNLGLALRQKHIAFQRYFKEFRNDEAYIVQRIREDLK